MGGSKLTTTGLVFGTPAYMAPEQAMGRPIDGRSDLYAVATILFEMLTGRVPFDHPDPMQQMRMQVKAPPPRPNSIRCCRCASSSNRPRWPVPRARSRRPTPC